MVYVPQRGCASADPMLLECVEVGNDAEARTRRRADRPVLRDLECDGEEPVASLGRPGWRVERHLEVRAGREGQRGVQVREQPVAVRPRVRAPPAALALGDRRDLDVRPSIPPISTTSGCTTSTPPRTTRSRASAAERTNSPAAIRTCRQARQLGVSVDVARSGGAPRASRRRGVSSSLAKSVAVSTLPARREVAGHAPALVRVDHDLELPARPPARPRSRVGRRASRVECRRIFVALTPCVAQRPAAANAFVRSRPARRSMRTRRCDRARRRASAKAVRPGRDRASPRAATSTIQLRPW